LDITDDGVEQMLVLAERLREANGGELDESAIQAVAEATGAPVEYVRLAVKLRSEKEKKSFLANIRSQYRLLEPHTRRYVLSGAAAASSALLLALDQLVSKITITHLESNYGIFAMLATITIGLGIYNVVLSRDSKTAALSGAVLAGGMFLMKSVFSLVFAIRTHVDPALFSVFSALGAAGGIGLRHFADKYRNRLGLKDPAKERQDLLKQLNHLQDKLTSGRQYMTFLSVDIVGSTRMKEGADPLAVEYTFGEYQEFVARISQKYGGRVHSTAGDGLICAFENPQHGFAAAKNIQAGIFELNALRNRLGVPLALRIGIHSGAVIPPQTGDVTSVNFSHVIDIASHLQKLAPSGGIVVSDAAVAQIAGGASSVGTERVQVMDIAASVWIPRQSAGSGILTPRPPLPGTGLA
jgi:class 3 adenylate cyclase